MIFSLFHRNKSQTTVRSIYGAIVTQARLPSFYRGYGVPDTPTGRFEMIVLHLTLLLRYFRGEEETRVLGQGIFDVFCSDMDDNLREMGTGDLSVPKKMRKMAEAFYGRAEIYERALAAGDDAPLAAALARYILERDGSPPAEARRLASYVRMAVGQLSSMSIARALHGGLIFPDPEVISGPI